MSKFALFEKNPWIFYVYRFNFKGMFECNLNRSLRFEKKNSVLSSTMSSFFFPNGYFRWLQVFLNVKYIPFFFSLFSRSYFHKVRRKNNNGVWVHPWFYFYILKSNQRPDRKLRASSLFTGDQTFPKDFIDK